MKDVLYLSLWIKKEADPDGPWHPFLVNAAPGPCAGCTGKVLDVFPRPRCTVHYLQDRAALHVAGTSTLERRTA